MNIRHRIVVAVSFECCLSVLNRTSQDATTDLACQSIMCKSQLVSNTDCVKMVLLIAFVGNFFRVLFPRISIFPLLYISFKNDNYYDLADYIK